ncbi:response regulator transcription factor [Xanthobacter tagetidis]|jgi:DNA-binding response OmpR family regulator|uniref:DNA-binding response regulator n=1 Tax=Xanthobacter tagetidis TaxID=60216 RepID=A0A3L7AIZ0_9HYPH|nr:response regulator transcription factor [Xanthobacter tagetidis]MBB6306356.1 DNA-binding response OmpR family regulator [Xanthobacter tagetidis]RLP79618.1 DNA-binding response regulator [Xanthobacter tagetidis]
MKVLPTARILLVDSDAERRQATRQALTAFGVGAVVEASSFEEIQPPAGTGMIDVLVVQVDDADKVPENPFRDGGSVPAILILEVAATMVARSAGRAGYDAGLAAPLQPRLLYRRIGSVLQRARRAARPSLSVLKPEMAGLAEAG